MLQTLQRASRHAGLPLIHTLLNKLTRLLHYIFIKLADVSMAGCSTSFFFFIIVRNWRAIPIQSQSDQSQGQSPYFSAGTQAAVK